MVFDVAANPSVVIVGESVAAGVTWRCSGGRYDPHAAGTVVEFRALTQADAAAVHAGRRETRGTYAPESLRRAEACLETALDKVRLAKVLFGDERQDSPRETLAAKAPVHHLQATEA